MISTSIWHWNHFDVDSSSIPLLLLAEALIKRAWASRERSGVGIRLNYAREYRNISFASRDAIGKIPVDKPRSGFYQHSPGAESWVIVSRAIILGFNTGGNRSEAVQYI